MTPAELDTLTRLRDEFEAARQYTALRATLMTRLETALFAHRADLLALARVGLAQTIETCPRDGRDFLVYDFEDCEFYVARWWNNAVRITHNACKVEAKQWWPLPAPPAPPEAEQ